MKTPEELRKDFWLEDEHRGGVIRKQYEEIKRVIHDNDFSWCLSQYEKIRQHAIDTVPYYKNTKLNTFPVLNKMDILDCYDRHRAKGNYDLPIHVSSTSGSTGTPFAVEQNYTKRQRNIADLQVFGELCDYPPRERMVFFRVINSKLHRTPEQEEKENIFYVDSSDLSQSHLQEMIDIVIEKKPRIIFSYASTLVELGRFALNKGIDVNSFTMRTVLTGGEGISEQNRLMLQKAFGCPVYRRYSDMELGILGQDMGDGGQYILNWGSYYFECLKIHSDEPTEDGEAGRIVITDLFNYAFPMIRYDTGDLGIMARGNNKLPVLREIYGRSRDCVYTTDGRLISPAKVSVMMWGSEGVKQWQFIQETEKDYVMKINANGKVDENGLRMKFQGLLGIDAQIMITYVDEIPVVSSNKRRAVICNLKRK